MSLEQRWHVSFIGQQSLVEVDRKCSTQTERVRISLAFIPASITVLQFDPF